MDKLIAFVKARLDEDEAAAKTAAVDVKRFAGRANWSAELAPIVIDAEDPDWAIVDLSPFVDDECLARHIARHDPARVLREVAAKRGRLALLAEATAEMDRLLADDTAGRVEQAMAIGRARAAAVAVKHDAAVWSDHPDYPLSGSRDAPEVPSWTANRTLSLVNTLRD